MNTLAGFFASMFSDITSPKKVLLQIHLNQSSSWASGRA
jgi:hypothetical protein